MESAVKYLLYALNKKSKESAENRPKSFVNFNIRDEEQLIDADTLWSSYIQEMKDINHLQKLVLARIFIPNKLISILH